MQVTRQFLTFFFGIISLTIHAQVVLPGGPFESYTRLINLKNEDLEDYTFNQSIYYGQDSLEWNLWGRYFPTGLKNNTVRFFDPEFKISYNSAYPRSYNDGPVWKGKGLTTELHAGLYGKFGILHFSLVPALFYSQNQSFGLAPTRSGKNKYSYQFTANGNIDWVQRYGDDPFVSLYPGQSEIRLIWDKVTLGVSTQNISFGPARYNPILMSKNAPGVPHVDLGTFSPVALRYKNIELGKVYARLYYGIMNESRYFDDDSGNDKRYFTGLTLNYHIPYVKGLKIGVNRVFFEDLDHFRARDLTRTFAYFSERDNVETSPGVFTNDLFDQMASFTVDWKFPEVGLRTYLEFAKNDFNGSFRDFMVDIDHSRAYTIGLEKAFSLRNESEILLNYEHTNLARNKGYLYRPVPPYYVHHLVKQGYTHDGQLMGAGIGPGSNSDSFGLNWYGIGGVAGINIQRIRFDDDYFIENYGNTSNNYGNKDLHDTEYTIGARYLKFLGRWAVGADARFSYRYNSYYEYQNDQVNVYLNLSTKFFIN